MWLDRSDWSDWTDEPAPLVIGCRDCPEVRDLIWPRDVGRWIVGHQAAAHGPVLTGYQRALREPDL